MYKLPMIQLANLVESESTSESAAELMNINLNEDLTIRTLKFWIGKRGNFWSDKRTVWTRIERQKLKNSWNGNLHSTYFRKIKRNWKITGIIKLGGRLNELRKFGKW